MHEIIQSVKNEALARIMEAGSEAELENLRIEYLGRNGKISKFVQQIKDLPIEEKKVIGRLVNDAKNAIGQILIERQRILTKQLTETDGWFDLSIPGYPSGIGHLHPMTQVVEEISDIFTYLGYQITDGPEIETDYYNFEALNFSPDHPARDSQQSLHIDTTGTKYKKGELLLRTQTSAMQVRVMEKIKPPFKILVPGRNFRFEQVDASHGFEFGQVEGFVVDKSIHLTDLFGTIEFFLKKLFGNKAEIKFATTNFPFVEPGVDTYLKCTICDGKGCAFCKYSGWSEIMPAGMIHPNVLKNAGIDSRRWGGFAFAIGSSRVVNLKYQIHDLRTLTTPDIRILKQF